MTDYRKAYGLPDRYFLSLGRMVEKKNLATLVSAYARYAEGVAVAGKKLKVKGERQEPVALVFVGSGELEGALREQARVLGLRVIDRSDWKAGQSSHGLTRIDTAESARQPEANGSERLAADRTGQEASCRVTPAVGKGPQKQAETFNSQPSTLNEENRGTVFFYGFRQIEENPVFYALAEAFVLPSLKEEWGLVVNEAMACSLPVIVSRTAGCAEDLLPGSEQVTSDGWRVTGKDTAAAKEADARAGQSMEHGARGMESGENADSLNVQCSTLNSLEERSNGFVFDPTSVDALSEALRRIADPLNVAYGPSPAIRPTVQRSTLNAAAMGRRSRAIVAQFSCENFAQQALRAAEAASA